MEKKSVLFLICFALIVSVAFSPLTSALDSVGGYNLSVSPSGDDANGGSFDTPLKTVGAAKERLKAS